MICSVGSGHPGLRLHSTPSRCAFAIHVGGREVYQEGKKKDDDLIGFRDGRERGRETYLCLFVLEDLDDFRDVRMLFEFVEELDFGDRIRLLTWSRETRKVRKVRKGLRKVEKLTLACSSDFP